eukprot:TRINITY_DN110818_c0_g1_i1.p1 TRINITY_DN110818_c0_g1~~TRINITY_DN110818_c0_g1_i1.p1  ORF type:complete len:168 (-),score=37.26 TRINITY_DN110818_c0_g1_i1:173-676(-)
MTMRMPTRLETDVDRDCYASLHHILKPEYHGLIDGWFKTAVESEKRGVLKLKRMGEPALLESMGRPRAMSQEPSIKPVQRMTRSLTSLSVAIPRPQTPSWVIDDATERAKIKKPGGCIINLRDSCEIMAAKNEQRNKGGTYKLFSGKFTGTTAQQSAHSLRALGLEK